MITYDYYRIFYHVALCHSFTKAAEILENNQPNITRCMNNLENELECKLFIRSNRGVRLTPEGERLFEHVTVAYRQLHFAEEELKKDRSLENGLISIAISETALHLLALNKLESFHESYPNVQLKISNFSTPQAVDALENGLVDFAIVTSPVNIKKTFQKILISSFHEILLGGSKYKHLTAKTNRLDELIKYPFVSLDKNTSTRELYTQYFLNHNLTFMPDIEASTADQILPMIVHNMGIGFYPEELSKEAISQHKVYPIRLCESFPKRQIYLILDKQMPKSTAVKKILNEFISNQEALSHTNNAST